MKTQKTIAEIINSIYEYLLVINPDLHRQIMVQNCKQQFKKYGFRNTKVTLPHITLMHSLRSESNETKILRKLKQLANGTKPFEIVLEDFDKFESTTSTVYLKVKTVDPILNIVERGRKEIKKLPRGKGVKNNFSNTPHITIARGLTHEQLEQVWPKWSSQSFSASFEATEMVLLKRPVNGGIYEEVAKLPFKGEALKEYVQGNLFN